ncbi:hypothetical protein KR018_009436 [Drosophila ironensis]|nr:hypothetical protein KR018_009436 [Drosophila ironensis]
MQQREKNHRRNIIEAKRGEATTWESFEDEPTPAKGKKQKTQKNDKEKATFGECEQGELPTDVKNFTFKERNFFRRKLTMGLSVASKNHSIDQATNDLRRNGVLSHGTAKFQDSDPQQGNPFHKKRFQGKKRPHKKGKVSK